MHEPAAADHPAGLHRRLGDRRGVRAPPPQTFIELSRAERKRDDINLEFGRLQLEQATLAEANRVDRIAREKLGMKFPEAADIVVVRP